MRKATVRTDKDPGKPYDAQRGTTGTGCPETGTYHIVDGECGMSGVSQGARRRSGTLSILISAQWLERAYPGEYRTWLSGRGGSGGWYLQLDPSDRKHGQNGAAQSMGRAAGKDRLRADRGNTAGKISHDKRQLQDMRCIKRQEK